VAIRIRDPDTDPYHDTGRGMHCPSASSFFLVLTSCSRLSWHLVIIFTTTTAVLRPFFWDHPGESVPEENLWSLWCKGRLTEADIPTIRMGATPSGLSSAHLHHPYFLRAGCPSCRPTNSVKALKATSTFGLGRRRQSSP